jgi:hypothetical protein
LWFTQYFDAATGFMQMKQAIGQLRGNFLCRTDSEAAVANALCQNGKFASASPAWLQAD